ncbi:hypothetical protein N9A70_02835 [Akkermansiaceae bacterium]|nr:hypothetical protein [Akkermansiaceae bacterium]
MDSNYDSFRVTQDFADFSLKNPDNPMEVRDVNLLPYPKEVILNSLALEMINEEDSGMQQIMMWHALTLASYQENVGPKPIFGLGCDPKDLLDVSVKDLSAMKSLVANVPENKEKWEKFQTKIKKERDEIEGIMMTASRFLNASSSEGKAILKIIYWTGWIGEQKPSEKFLDIFSKNLDKRLSNVDYEQALKSVHSGEIGGKEIIELIKSLNESSERIKKFVFQTCMEVRELDEEECSVKTKVVTLMFQEWKIQELT